MKTQEARLWNLLKSVRKMQKAATAKWEEEGTSDNMRRYLEGKESTACLIANSLSEILDPTPAAKEAGGLTAESERLFGRLVAEAIDYGGSAWLLQGDLDKQIRGNLTDLKKRGLLSTHADTVNEEKCFVVQFEDKGRNLARSLGWKTPVEWYEDAPETACNIAAAAPRNEA